MTAPLTMSATLLAAATDTGTGEAVAFWLLGSARRARRRRDAAAQKAVHCALLLA